MRAERDIVMALNSSVCLSNARVVSKRIHISLQFWWSGKDIIPYSPTRVYDSLTSRGMPLMPGLQHLGECKHALRPSGPARVWASMRDESAAVAELSRRRNLWKRSRKCMPVGEFLNSKTMLTKILLTYTTKLNVAFKLTPPITPKLEHWPITSNTLG